jgi:SAM-dependent methyltransferase
MKQKSEIETQELASGYYEEKRYREDHSRYYHDWWTSKLLSLVDVRGRVLDNGCGTGILFQALPDAPCTLYGLDISRGMLTYARPRSRRLVHHLPDPGRGIREIARILKPGGQVAVVDTNASLLSALPRRLARRSDHFSDDHKNMSARLLADMIREFFTVDAVYHFGYLAYPLGFPDILDIARFIPRPLEVTKMLTKLDALISTIPLLRTQSWGIMIKGTRM